MIRMSGSQLDSEEKRDEFINLRTSAQIEERFRTTGNDARGVACFLHNQKRMDKIFSFLYSRLARKLSV